MIKVGPGNYPPWFVDPFVLSRCFSSSSVARYGAVCYWVELGKVGPRALTRSRVTSYVFSCARAKRGEDTRARCGRDGGTHGSAFPIGDTSSSASGPAPPARVARFPVVVDTRRRHACTRASHSRRCVTPPSVPLRAGCIREKNRIVLRLQTGHPRRDSHDRCAYDL